MIDLIFVIICLAGVFALAMRQAPLWLWALALGAATLVWTSGILDGLEGVEGGVLTGLVWLPTALLALLSIPPIRRRLIVAPTFTAIKQVLPKLFENDESAARPAGSMEVLKIIWWRHNCKSGQYSSAKVHRTLTVHPDGTISFVSLEGLAPEIIDGF